MDGWLNVKAVLKIAYTNQRLKQVISFTAQKLCNTREESQIQKLQKLIQSYKREEQS